jgi:hypothetical protein
MHSLSLYGCVTYDRLGLDRFSALSDYLRGKALGFVRGEPKGALGWTLALEDSGCGFEPAAAERVLRGKEREGFGVEGAEASRGLKGESLEKPTVLIEEWHEDGLAGLEAG